MLIACTFLSNNVSGGSGGDGVGAGAGGEGGSGRGGAVYARGIASAYNCTLTLNTASGGNGGMGGTGGGDGGSGDGQGGALSTDGPAALVHCTIVECSALAGAGAAEGDTLGGGLHFTAPGSQLMNTLVAFNTAATAGRDVSGTVQSLGGNLVREADGSAGWNTQDQLGSTNQPLDPRLGPVGDNGGLTPTFSLLPDSPAIDRANDASVVAPWNVLVDQRGQPRQAGNHTDIGSVEN